MTNDLTNTYTSSDFYFYKVYLLWSVGASVKCKHPTESHNIASIEEVSSITNFKDINLITCKLPSDLRDTRIYSLTAESSTIFYS